ncbi:Transferase [Parasponia andersonii]|uniref:Transferase n=1 Tax=Parasponia andersonii TaxID=3476 RepID=A0A2P5DNT4_PARAD|nr:Transferase [Parasponia andersonii]
MTKFTVKEKIMVKPAEKLPRQSVWMSGLDLMTGNVHSPLIYFYKPNAEDSKFFDPKVLKESLSKVLAPFYPMAGRFRLDHSGRHEIDCNGEGVLFIVAKSSSLLEDFRHFAPTPVLRSLCPAVDYSGGISSYPFMLLQVTYFSCGGVSLGFRMEHRVADAPAFFHFTKEWSNMARGLDITIPPFLDRTIFRPPREVPNNMETRLYFPTNGRYSRLKPRPPSNYFGTGVFTATSTAVVSDLQSKPLWFASSRIHETLIQMDDDYLRSAIDYLEAHLNTERSGAHCYKSPNFKVTSWMKMPIYEADFGWGNPIYMGPGGNINEGKAYIIPSGNEDGSLFLVIALQQEQMKVFEKLFYECTEVKQLNNLSRASL